GAGGWGDSLMESQAARKLLEWLSVWMPGAPENLAETLKDVATSTSLRVAEWLGQLLTHVPGMVLDLVLIVVSLYFSLVDGHELVSFARSKSPFTEGQTG